MPGTLPESLQESLAPYLDGPVRSCEPVGGGCIAHASRLETGGTRYFLKWGDGAVGETFPAESFGLSLLHTAKSPLRIPRVLAAEAPGEAKPGFLLMEWIEAGTPGASFWKDFGRALAALHRNAGQTYGAERDNFIGRLPQVNTPSDGWPAFFRTCRLELQVRMARERGRWSASWDTPLDHLYARLHDLLPAKPPASVLHGDLWSGNFMVTSMRGAALVDPAAYYGHRETDLAMTELFGGFQPGFYDAYREAWPLEPGYEDRKELYNLYHLINHLNHFGQSYAGSVAGILRRFS